MSHQTPTQPKLTDLLANYLTHQAQAQVKGLADWGAGSEVTPYEAGPVQPIDRWNPSLPAICETDEVH